MSYLGIWFALVATISILSNWCEDTIHTNKKSKLTRWIKSVSIPESFRTWPVYFIITFDAIFGSRHFKKKCFFRSCVESIAYVFIITIFWGAFHPDVFWAAFFKGPYIEKTYYLLIIHTIIINLIPDYVSLFETRKILGYLSENKKFTKLLVILLIDFLLTFLIALTAFVFSLELFAIIKDGHLINPKQHYSLIKMFIQQTMIFELNPPGAFGNINTGLKGVSAFFPMFDASIFFPVRLPGAIWFYSTFFTSIWAYFYAISIIATKILIVPIQGFKIVKSFLDIDEKPIRSIGLVFIVLFTIVYWFCIAIMCF